MAAHQMTCPPCTMWDQALLTCVSDPNADPAKCTFVIVEENIAIDGGNTTVYKYTELLLSCWHSCSNVISAVLTTQ